MSKVIAAGHICLDITPTINSNGAPIAEVLRPGRLVSAGQCVVSLGGPVPNTGIAMSILGQDVSLMCKTGNDLFGGVLRELIEKFGTKMSISCVPDVETSYTVALVVPGYDRIFLHDAGANNTFVYDDIDFDEVAKCQLFHFGYPPNMRKIYENGGEELVKIFKKAKELGATTSLDMTLPDKASHSGQQDWDAILQAVLPYVDIYIPSVEETLFMLYPDKYDAFFEEHKGERDPLETMDADILPMLGDKLLSYGAKIAVIKCGVRGYYIRTAEKLEGFGRIAPADVDEWSDREIICESYHIDNIASATGSGDSSIAGFLSSFMEGYPLYKSLETACAVGAENITAMDALSGIKSMEETQEFKKSLSRNSYKYNTEYWLRDENNQLVFGKNDKTRK